MTEEEAPAKRGEMQSCQVCGSVFSSEEGLERCPCCEAPYARRKPQSLQKTVAWLVTAMILYVPANTLPMMITYQFNRPLSSTILGGAALLWHHGSYFVAGIIFVASVLVPLAKMVSLSWLCWISSYGYRMSDKRHHVLYEWTERLGRWSMIDVCVVAVLVALVQMGGLMKVSPGAAGIAFAGVVISTMLAALSFDPRLIWDAIEKRNRE